VNEHPENPAVSPIRAFDKAVDLYRKNFVKQITLGYFLHISTFLLVVLILWLGIYIIIPALSVNVEDRLNFGIRGTMVVVAISFLFILYQSAVIQASGAIQAKMALAGENISFANVIRKSYQYSPKIFTVTIAQIIVIFPIIAIFLAVAATALGFGNLLSIFANASFAEVNFGIIIFLFLVLFTIHSIVRFFVLTALPAAVSEKALFFAALLTSAKRAIAEFTLENLIFSFVRSLLKIVSLILVFMIFRTLFSPPILMADILTYEFADSAFAAVLTYFATIALAPISRNFAAIIHSPPAPEIPPNPTANAGSRTLAAAFDMAILAAAFFLIFWLILQLFSGRGVSFSFSDISIAGGLIATLAFFVTYAIYNVYFEVFGGGQTPSKRLFGLIVLPFNYENVKLSQSLLRNFFRILDIPLGPAIMAIHPDNMRIGDILTDTQVVYKEESEYELS